MEWNWTETKYKAEIVGYENVVGSPSAVEARVKSLINEGWETNGPLMPYDYSGRSTGLYVQSVVKYIENKKGNLR